MGHHWGGVVELSMKTAWEKREVLLGKYRQEADFTHKGKGYRIYNWGLYNMAGICSLDEDGKLEADILSINAKDFETREKALIAAVHAVGLAYNAAEATAKVKRILKMSDDNREEALKAMEEAIK